MKTILMIMLVIAIAVFTGTWIFDGLSWLFSGISSLFSFLSGIFNLFGWKGGML